MDVFDNALMREAAIHMSYGTDPNEALPFDSGLRAAAEMALAWPVSHEELALLLVV